MNAPQAISTQFSLDYHRSKTLPARALQRLSPWTQLSPLRRDGEQLCHRRSYLTPADCYWMDNSSDYTSALLPDHSRSDVLQLNVASPATMDSSYRHLRGSPLLHDRISTLAVNLRPGHVTRPDHRPPPSYLQTTTYPGPMKKFP